MKICMILTNGFDPDVRVYKEALYLTKEGFSVDILCWDRNADSDYPECEVIDGITIKRFKVHSMAGTGYRQLPAFFKFCEQIKRYLKVNTYDYLHCHDFDGRFIAFLVGAKGQRCVFDMHEFYERGNSLKRLLFRKATLFLIKNSKAAMYENDIYLAPPYGKYKDKLFSLKNYPDRSMIVALPKTESEVFRIGYHGAVRNQIPYFAALFEAVKGRADIRVDINGTGIDYPQLVEMAKKYDNVYVHGKYDGTKESSKLYANTDVLFCGYDKKIPNHQKEAEAVKFFEAIITGTPMIMQKNIGMGDKVIANGYGIAVETDSFVEIKEAIEKFMNDRDFYNSCRDNELLHAQRYNWENEVRILNRIYQ